MTVIEVVEKLEPSADQPQKTSTRSQKATLLSFLARAKDSGVRSLKSDKLTLLLRSGVFVHASISETDGVSLCTATAHFPDDTVTSLVSGDLSDEPERHVVAERIMNMRGLVMEENLSREELRFHEFTLKKISAMGASGNESLWEVALENENVAIGQIVFDTIGVVAVKSSVQDDRECLRFRVSGAPAEVLTEVDRVQDELLRARLALSAAIRERIAGRSFRN